MMMQKDGAGIPVLASSDAMIERPATGPGPDAEATGLSNESNAESPAQKRVCTSELKGTAMMMQKDGADIPVLAASEAMIERPATGPGPDAEAAGLSNESNAESPAQKRVCSSELKGTAGLDDAVSAAPGAPLPGGSSEGASGSATPSRASRTTLQIKVVPYGILGSGSSGLAAAEPDEETVIVDPAGMHHIQGSGPGGASGAAGVIYKWLGIRQHPAFPADVRAAIKESLQAKFHAYGVDASKKCIHVVGPDFRVKDYTRAEAVAALAEAYKNILTEFCKSELRQLRLLPVSGGIFSGRYRSQIAALTADALEAGFNNLDDAAKQHVLSSSIEMCIFERKEVRAFQVAFEKRGLAA